MIVSYFLEHFALLKTLKLCEWCGLTCPGYIELNLNTFTRFTQVNIMFWLCLLSRIRAQVKKEKTKSDMRPTKKTVATQELSFES